MMLKFDCKFSTDVRTLHASCAFAFATGSAPPAKKFTIAGMTSNGGGTHSKTFLAVICLTRFATVDAVFMPWVSSGGIALCGDEPLQVSAEEVVFVSSFGVTSALLAQPAAQNALA